jgi:hypothetical protein
MDKRLRMLQGNQLFGILRVSGTERFGLRSFTCGAFLHSGFAPRPCPSAGGPGPSDFSKPR